MSEKIRAERFGTQPGDFREVVCYRCIYFDPKTKTCDAFPDGIPEDILSGENDHTSEYPGDGGIRFEPKFGPPHAEKL